MGRGGRGRLNLGRCCGGGGWAPIHQGDLARPRAPTGRMHLYQESRWGRGAAAERGPDRTVAVAEARGEPCGARLQGSLPWWTALLYLPLSLSRVCLGVVLATIPRFLSSRLRVFRYRVVQAGGETDLQTPLLRED